MSNGFAGYGSIEADAYDYLTNTTTKGHLSVCTYWTNSMGDWTELVWEPHDEGGHAQKFTIHIPTRFDTVELAAKIVESAVGEEAAEALRHHRESSEVPW